VQWFHLGHGGVGIEERIRRQELRLRFAYGVLRRA
jgi:hypothetical protein